MGILFEIVTPLVDCITCVCRDKANLNRPRSIRTSEGPYSDCMVYFFGIQFDLRVGLCHK